VPSVARGIVFHRSAGCFELIAEIAQTLQPIIGVEKLPLASRGFIPTLGDADSSSMATALRSNAKILYDFTWLCPLYASAVMPR
jgi:hypothetical protein